MVSHIHTNHKSREGIRSSASTIELISITDISPEACNTRSQLCTKLREGGYSQPLPPHPILLYERTTPPLNNKSSREGELTPGKFKRGLMSANTLPTFLLLLLLLFDSQILRSLQIQVQERGPNPRKFKRRARYLTFSYPTK